MTSLAVNAPPAESTAERPAAPAAGGERLRALAQVPLAASAGRGPRLLARLRDPERAIEDAYQRLAAAPPQLIEASHEAEWLLDNHYIVRRAVRGLREEFPVGFQRKLRVVAAGPSAGLPLVYEVAREIVASGECHVDIDSLTTATADFQTMRALTIAEVWALPALLRLALLERLAAATAVIPGIDSSLTAPAEADAGRVIANAMRSLRALETANWKQFFESVSVVERRLAEDPARLYTQMDFATRDRYRKAVEELAVDSTPADEVAVAGEAVRLAGQDADSGARRGHVGHYLIGSGRPQLERAVQYRPPWRLRWRRWLTVHPTAVYLGGTVLLSVAILAAVSVGVRAGGAGVLLTAVVALAVIPAVTVAVSVLNDLLTRVLAPRVLAKLDFSRGIPSEWRTLVAVPALLSDPAEIDDLMAGLEIRHLATGDPQVHFALLSDLVDAPSEHLPSDDALMQQTADGIAALNAHYGSNGTGPFHLLHRPRRWNARERCWMGWERKRGKLTQLNRWLLGAAESDFTLQVGDEGFRGGVRFVIVLDADTDLPRDEARTMAAALAHPLNRAEFDAASGAVVAGYTVLQPRVEISPLSASASRFAALFSPAAGLDPYTHAVSDVYQDLFGEGTFVGKGIYDVAAFERSLAGVAPDNALLSHDLFEGIQGRAGLLSDSVLFEDYPSHYLAYTRRLERWVRGDWQLLPWLGRRVPVEGGQRGPNRLSAIARWKILDNLRRSLLTPALLAFLLVVWFFVPGALPWWTLAAVAVPAVPALLGVVGGLVTSLGRRVRGVAPAQRGSLRAALGGWFCEVAFLPHTAVLVSVAILRTLGRVYVTRRHLLQWTSAAHTARAVAGHGAALWLCWREMIAAPLVGGATAALLALVRPAALPVAAPLLLLWCVAPGIASHLSRPASRRAPGLTAADRQRLRIVARRTWSFFEAFVSPADQWLPPDHFQEEPRGVLARRTSPTNIGLLQLAVVAAVDFGYCGILSMALQLKNTFDTLDRLERYRGHFLNWYGTAGLEPLEPRYVSTVDSGNLAACLLAVKQGCLELLTSPAVRVQQWSGFLDTLAVFRQVVEEIPTAGATALVDLIARIEQRVDEFRADPSRWRGGIAALLGDEHPALERQLVTLLQPDPARLDPALLAELRRWSAALKEHLERMQREVDLLLPWLAAWRELPPFLAGPLPEALVESWQALAAVAAAVPTVVELPAVVATARAALAVLRQQLAAVPAPAAAEAVAWSERLDSALTAAAQAADYLGARLREAAARAEAVVSATDFGLLYDRQRRLFFIGYNVSAGRMDEHHYDLLASEARLASFVAIARGAVPEEHWIQLGRPIGEVAGGRGLLSWSGTMFEYLMPALLLREGEATLIGQSCRAAVREQIAYGRRRGVPWGISECGYYRFDAQYNYQYRAFGVPALGFKRGLDDDLVVAPYASVLALPFAPAAVVANLARLRELGGAGPYGFYEAIDFTAGRQNGSEPAPVVRSFMAHHQGMVLAALDNALNGDALVRRFHADPPAKTAELLLYERPAYDVPIEQAHLERTRAPRAHRRSIIEPWPAAVDAPFPQAHVLSNGHYSVVTTAVGGGSSQCGNVALTRWSPDSTLDDDGFRIYVRDQIDGRFWTLFRDPGPAPSMRRVVFAPHMVEREARYDGLTVRERLTVVPDADVEIRHLTLASEGRRRRVTVTGYGEVVLGDAAADRRHPAFSKLFVESEYLAAEHALVLHRRPRAPGEAPLYLVHTMALPRGARPNGYDCARESFIGRGATARAPATLTQWRGRLAGRSGATLDPVMALAASLELPPRRTRELAFITATAESRDAALDLARRYRSIAELDWTFELARHRADAELAGLGIDGRDLPALTTLLSLLLYPHPALRAPLDVLTHNTAGRSALYQHALSGDLPILLVRVGHAPHAPLLPVLLQAQAFWRGRGVAVDLVVLNERPTSYDAQTDDRVLRAISAAGADAWLHRPGGVFVVHADRLNDADRTAMLSAAGVVVDGTAESLAQQVATAAPQRADLPPLMVTATDGPADEGVQRPADLLFDNGLGGFSPDGREYVIHLKPGAHTPAPWVNVVANPRCGFVVSETGGGYTWVGNSGENRLTPWSNDPVTDAPGESVYLRDEETGAVWSPTPRPARGGGAYRVRHGVGYTVFEHRCRGLDQRLRVFVPPDDPLKIVELQIANRSDRPRRLTVTYYVEWVLGTTRAACQSHIVPAFDPESEALTARNPWNDELGEAVAFVAAGSRLHGFTADRSEFLGRHGDRARPAALLRIGLAGAVRPGADPCAALQVHVDLPAGETHVVHFLLGQGDSHAHALELVRRYREPAAVATAWTGMEAAWERIVGARRVRTPDAALDLMLNRWLPYQTLSARVWGRSGFYQSSGAYGYRDQLQDLAAFVDVAPELCRAHLLTAAAHQFEEGDVLHWWHPPSNAGLRSRCSDDLLWLPFVTAHYVQATGDHEVLSAPVPYLNAAPLGIQELERYARFAPGGQSASLYDHCGRALDKAWALGPHGLPLFGSGDWNDGMNRVGAGGRGESVWLGWFLHATLTRFAPLCALMGEAERAEELRGRAETLRAALQRSGWDGGWYLRGYYDDGSPLGAARRDECRIDSIAQSWAVLSGAADPVRARQAMHAVRERLLREERGLLLLLAPPFDRSLQQPGYIKGYPPGVRENGGQYTHAAVWAVWAWAALGEVDLAARCFAALLPVGRTSTAEKVQRYRGEPYVVAADIYDAEAYSGRAGWTWYTGSAAWAYRFGWEMLLGLRPQGDAWRIDPNLPSAWPGFAITLRDGDTVYEIEVLNPHGATRGVDTLLLDDTPRADLLIPRLRDHVIHRVRVTMQAPSKSVPS